ncbi:MAG: phospholipid carrier-dependent glycosyltransferase [Actinobacteria bacterium]|nr:phospholipid carrier-dependent glycosyltransferase [Actinomycetota bacterium]
MAADLGAPENGTGEMAGSLLEEPCGRSEWGLERWLWLAGLLLVFAAALAWRWHFASRARIYTYDSYFYMVLARNLRHGFSYSVTGHPHYKFMPLYPMAIAFLDLFFPLEFAGKFSNVLFSAACVFPIYAIGSMVFGRRAGLAAAGLFAFEPISVAWSAAPMSDGLLALLVCLGACFFLRWIKEERGGFRWLYLAAGASGLAMVTRWEGSLILVLQGLFLIYYWWRRRLRLRNLIAFAAIAAAPFALLALRNLLAFGTPLKSAYLEELRNHPADFEKYGPWERLGRYFMYSDVPPLGISSRYYHYAYLVFGYSGLVMAMSLRSYRRYAFFILLWLLFLGPLHFFWYFASVRFLIPAVPPLCLGAGAIAGTPWVETAWRRESAALNAVLLFVAASLVGVLALTARPMTNDIFNHGIVSLEDEVGGLAARDAALWLRDNAGDAGVTTSLGPLVSFYLGRDALFLGEWQGFEPADIEIPDLVPEAREKGVRYVVLWSWEPEVEAPLRYIGLGPEMLDRLKLVSRWYAPPSSEWNREVYAWIFEVPPEGE